MVNMKRLLILIATLLSLTASAQFKNVQIPQNDYPVNGNIIQRVNNQWRTRTLAQLRVDLNIADSSYILEALESYVPTSRTITINGDTFDLSENRSWTVTAALDTASLSDRINLKQNADADLTTYASITPTTVAQSLLAFANPSAIRFLRVNADNTVSGRTAAEVLSDIGAAASGHDHSGVYQAADADLTTYAGITPTTIGQAILNFASPSAVRYFKINADNTITGRTAAEMLSDLGAASSAHDHSALYQPLDANLTTYASIAPSTVAQGILSLANPSAVRYLKVNADNSVSFRTAAEMQTDLSISAGAFADITGDPSDNAALDAALDAKQASNTLLTQLSAITFAENDFPVYVSSTLTNRTPTQVKAILDLDQVPNQTAQEMVSSATVDGSQINDGTITSEKFEEVEQLDYYQDEVRALRALGAAYLYRTVSATWQASTTAQSLVDNSVRLAALTEVFRDTTITGISYNLVTAGVFTADQTNGVALYSLNTSTGVLTLLGQSAADANGDLWKTTTGFRDVALSSPVAVTEGTVLYIAFLYNNSAQTTAPQLVGPAGSSNRSFTLSLPNSIKTFAHVPASNSFPASITMSTTSNVNETYLGFVY
jgi:hypothetical protein